MTKTINKLPICIGAAAMLLWAGIAFATNAATPAPILIELSPMQAGPVFGCRIPVNVQYSGLPTLTWANAQAWAYRGREMIASAGIDTARDPLLGDEAAHKVKYDTAPIGFDLTPDLCRTMTEVDIVEANCSFDNGPAQDCLDLLRLSEPPGSKLKFAIGKPLNNRTVLSKD